MSLIPMQIKIKEIQIKALMLDSYNEPCARSTLNFLHLEVEGKRIIVLIPLRLLGILAILKQNISYTFRIREFSSRTEIRYKLIGIL